MITHRRFSITELTWLDSMRFIVPLELSRYVIVLVKLSAICHISIYDKVIVVTATWRHISVHLLYYLLSMRVIWTHRCRSRGYMQIDSLCSTSIVHYILKQCRFINLSKYISPPSRGACFSAVSACSDIPFKCIAHSGGIPVTCSHYGCATYNAILLYIPGTAILFRNAINCPGLIDSSAYIRHWYWSWSREKSHLYYIFIAI